ncbi:cell division protein FtsQ/DivIB [Caldalkalibacillus mannanilyticus]|uniref:cell division protein FtsQ/DivIB n=1 Tax=Caldalkalibacillus mannanilyticus TaxID=1418 RepID=UPI00046AF319|nr:FtsQ-type POTRA domain-containing protein [Caldalkalibacillus mannanilyticus]
MNNNSNVIYDDRIPRLKEPPQKRKPNKLFLFLVVFFFLFVVCILYFQSPYSKLAEIEITGAQILREADIHTQANIEIGMSFYNFSVSSIENKLNEMVEISEVTVERNFPNKLKIHVVEHPYTAFWLEDDQLYPVLSTGHILLHRSWNTGRVDRPILTDWPTKEGIIELSQELVKLPTIVMKNISEITLTPMISDPYRLTLYMNDGFEVRTTIRKFAENLSMYPNIYEETPHEEGIFYFFDGVIWIEDPAQAESAQDEEKKGE